MRLMTIRVLGEPVGKGRPRVTTIGGHARAYTPAKTAAWEQEVAHEASRAWRGNPPHEGPVKLTVYAVASRPKRLLRLKDPENRILRPTKPDADNVAKAVGDALEKAGVIRDDVQVTTLIVRSLYAGKSEGPMVEVYMDEDDIKETPCAAHF